MAMKQLEPEAKGAVKVEYKAICRDGKWLVVRTTIEEVDMGNEQNAKSFVSYMTR